MITQQELKQLFHYDPFTGEFTRAIDRRRFKAGERAGCLAKGKHAGYRVIRIDNKLYREHCLAFLYMTGDWPLFHVDHENHDRADNRWVNLKEVTHAENQQNMKKQSNKTSVLGVTQIPSGKYRAQMSYNKKPIHLGYYDTLEEAAQARADANVEYGFHRNHGK